MKGGTLYTLPIGGGPDRKAIEIFKTGLQVFGPRFSPDGRFLAYTVDRQGEQRGDLSCGRQTRRRVGNHVAGVRRLRWACRSGAGAARSSITSRAIDPSWWPTSAVTPSFSFTKPRVLFRPQSAIPEVVRFVSLDGDRFLVVPPPRGPQLQQLTIFDRQGKVLEKVGEPGLFQPAGLLARWDAAARREERHQSLSDLE